MTEDLEILDDWNAWLACCCQMPACPVPIKVCQSLTRGASSYEGPDTEYEAERDAYAASLDTWLYELENAWLADRDAWVAEVEGRIPEDFPTAQPEPRNEEDYEDYPPPEAPEGYEENAHGSWVQFSEPGIAAGDDLPFLYRRYKVTALFHGEIEESRELISGTHGDYRAVDDTRTADGIVYHVQTSYFEHYERTYTNEVPSFGGNSTSGIATFSRAGAELTCDVTFDSGGNPPPGYITGSTIFGPTYYIPPGFIEAEAGWVITTPGGVPVCTPTTRGHTGDIEEMVYGDPLTAPTCGSAPWVGTPLGDGAPSVSPLEESSWADLTRTFPSYGEILSSPINKDGLKAMNLGKFPSEWPEIAEGSSCRASHAIYWPKKQDVLGGGVEAVEADPEAVPPVIGVDGVDPFWPPCDDPDVPKTEIASTFSTKSRYRWRAPSLIVMGDNSDSDSTPDDIIDWWRGTYLRVTWQVCFFSREWEAWKALWDEYVELLASGSDSTPPPHPGPQPAPPVLGENQTDTWIGPGDPEVDSSWLFPGGWHEIEPPETEGESRVVNIRFYCYPDSPYGYLPQVTGEAYEPIDEFPSDFST